MRRPFWRLRLFVVALSLFFSEEKSLSLLEIYAKEETNITSREAILHENKFSAKEGNTFQSHFLVGL